MMDFYRQENKEAIKKVDDIDKLALIGMTVYAQEKLDTLHHYDPVVFEVVDVFLDTTLDYSLSAFDEFLSKIKVWDYSDFCKQFKTLSQYYTYDNLLNIISTLFNIECYWSQDDWCNDLIVCYDYFEDDTDINKINIIGTYMECERLMTLQEKEVLSIKDIESTIECIDMYLNNYLSELSHNLEDDDIYKYADNILNRVDQLIGGVL